MLSFYERMELAKAAKPASGGKFYAQPKRRLESKDTHDSWCRRQFNYWLICKRQILNDFRAACLNGTMEPESF